MSTKVQFSINRRQYTIDRADGVIIVNRYGDRERGEEIFVGILREWRHQHAKVSAWSDKLKRMQDFSMEDPIPFNQLPNAKVKEIVKLIIDASNG